MIETEFNGTFSTEFELMAYLYQSNLHQDGEPSVYVGTYGKYNAGSLKGRWISIGEFSCYEEFIEFCRLYHRDEEDPELMFQDYENFPGEWYCESCMGEETFDKIKQYAEMMQEERERFDAFCEVFEPDFEACENRCLGKFDSEEDFAEYIAEECCFFQGVPDTVKYYFDYKAYARDLFMCDYTYSDGYVFSNY